MSRELPWWAADFLRAARSDPELRARGIVSVVPGKATVLVEGRGFRPSRVVVRAPLLSARRWEIFFEVCSREALPAAALFAGYLPRSLKLQLARNGVRLIPRPSRISREPPDGPAETAAAGGLLVARHFAANPFRLLHFRGRNRQDVLAALARPWKAASGRQPAIGLAELEAILDRPPQSGADRSLLPPVQRAETFRTDPVLRAGLTRLYTKVRERAAALGPRRAPRTRILLDLSSS